MLQYGSPLCPESGHLGTLQLYPLSAKIRYRGLVEECSLCADSGSVPIAQSQSNCRGVECLAPRQRRLETSQELVQHRVDARLRALFGLRAGQSCNANAADRLVIDDDGKAAS